MYGKGHKTMINLIEFADYDLAKLLNNKIWSDKKYAYAAEDVEVSWGDFLTIRKYKEGEIITDGDNVRGKVYYALTYAELIKLLDKCYGIVIDFQPAFTFSTKGHIAYFYKVYRKNDKERRLDLLFEEKEWLPSFEFAMEAIISELLKRNFIN